MTGELIAELYDCHEPRLRWFARTLSPREEEVDDLVQETFVRVIRSIETLQFMSPAQRTNWLKTTLRRLWIDRYHANRIYEVGTDGSGIERQDVLDSIVDERLEFARAVDIFKDCAKALRSLDERDALIVRLSCEWEFTSREIARELGIPPGTVRSRLSLTLKRIKQEFQDEQI